MITIGGTTITSPMSMTVGVYDISKSERNSLGNMIIEIIATKRKLELQWPVLTAAQLSTLLGLMSATTFTVVYSDPVTGAARTMTAYKGDRSLGMLFYNAGVPSWKDTKVSLIEI